MSRERNTSGEKRSQELRFRLVKFEMPTQKTSKWRPQEGRSMYKGENKGVG